MARIHQLPAEVFTKIAAGEVIDRPASVVKELIENAVDAASRRIRVEIDQGGVERIGVYDDGEGIHPDDLPLVFSSHATSKLERAEDLFHVQTLGFRGEALASIGGVAEVRIQSRPADVATGAEVVCTGGRLAPIRPWSGRVGTRVEVRRLFYNTPVRRKFLRTATTEMGHITEAVTRLALAYPSVQFHLSHNGRVVYDVAASATLPDRLRLFFGSDVSSRLLPVESTQGPARLSGFVADPAINRPNSRLQYFFVNGRWIRDRSLGHALQEAYRGLLMTGRYPIAFLFIELPPDAVDVNVHPTKTEVRFRDPQAMYHLILSSVRGRLRRGDLAAAVPIPVGEPGARRHTANPPFTLRSGDEARQQPVPFPPPSDVQSPPSPVPRSAPVQGGSGVEPDGGCPAAPEPCKAIQLHDAYLVLETPDGMLVIDQHALHERIIYEEWKSRVSRGDLECQRLLVPEPVDLPADQAAAALEHRDLLARLGLQIGEFGGSTILVMSHPALVKKCSPEQLLRAAVDFLVQHDRPPRAEQLLDDVLRVLACRGAIKAGDRLSDDEIQALIAQRHLVENTHHCPHGRPTALFFSRQDLDRQFKRT